MRFQGLNRPLMTLTKLTTYHCLISLALICRKPNRWQGQSSFPTKCSHMLLVRDDEWPSGKQRTSFWYDQAMIAGGYRWCSRMDFPSPMIAIFWFIVVGRRWLPINENSCSHKSQASQGHDRRWSAIYENQATRTNVFWCGQRVKHYLIKQISNVSPTMLDRLARAEVLNLVYIYIFFTALPRCGGDLTSPVSTIRAPVIPVSYNKEVICRWNINVSVNLGLVLSLKLPWHDNMGCRSFLSIKSDQQSGGESRDNKICSKSDLPDEINIQSNVVSLEYHAVVCIFSQ